MADTDELMEQLSGLTVLEIAGLVKQLEEKWGVSAAAPVAAAAGPAAAGPGGGAAAAPAEEKSTFEVVLTEMGSNKIAVIKEVRATYSARPGMEPARPYAKTGVPNVFLTYPLQTVNAKTGAGGWNAAHFSNTQYNKLSQQYIAARDLSTQRQIAGQIQTLLLNETPIIFGYFYDYLSAWAKNVSGVYPTAIGHLFLNKATKS